MPGPEGSAVARWRGLAGIAARRLLARITRTERQQTLLAVGGIALAVALVLVVTSVGAGMLAQSTVATEETDYWIVPEGAASSVVTDVKRQQLGRVHAATDRIQRREDVAYAAPILMTLVDARAPGTEKSASLVVIGTIPSADQESLVGLSTDRLTPGDPYYAGGTYDGTWTGEAVLSAGAAEALGLSRGGSFAIDRGGSSAIDRGGATESRYVFSATDVSETRAAGVGQLPVAIVHLSELQRLTGADGTDSADQILVAASDSSAKAALEGVYPGTDVVTRRGLMAQQAGRSNLPVAISLAAFVIAVVVGTLFLGTTMGMEIAAGSRHRAVLSALGFSVGSRAAVVALQALGIALLGGLAGVVAALLGVAATNVVVTSVLSDVPVATFHPAFVAYGLGVALLIGLLSLPYLLVVSWRSVSTEALVR